MNLRDSVVSINRYVYKIAQEIGYCTDHINIINGALSTKAPKDLQSGLWMIVLPPGGKVSRLAVNIEEYVQPFQIFFIAEIRDRSALNTCISPNSNCPVGKSGDPYFDIMNFMSEFHSKLLSNKWLIPGLLTNFNYPVPLVELYHSELTSGIDPGDYYVTLQAINNFESNPIESTETLISVPPVAVTLDEDNNAMRVHIPQFPIGIYWFREFNIFAGSDPWIVEDPDNNSNNILNGDGGLYKQNNEVIEIPANLKRQRALQVYEIEELLEEEDNRISYSTLSDAWGNLSNTINNKFQYLAIKEETFGTSIFQDPEIESGRWIGSINFVSCFNTKSRYVRNGLPIRSVGVDKFVSVRSP